jgi:hypothetical protein
MAHSGRALGASIVRKVLAGLGFGPWAKAMRAKTPSRINFGFMERGGLSRDQKSHL